MANIIMITGGARSGKSTFAEKLALDFYTKDQTFPIAYLATAEITDLEFKKRIAIHQERRSQKFKTYEESLYLDKILNKIIPKHNIILIECLTTWLGNIFFKSSSNNFEKFVNKIINSIIDKMKGQDKILIFVTNEIGLGIVPGNEISREFRDIQGRLNQKIAKIANKVSFIISGLEMKVKG